MFQKILPELWKLKWKVKEKYNMYIYERMVITF